VRRQQLGIGAVLPTAAFRRLPDDPHSRTLRGAAGAA
jgi:hypothetical protein